MAIEIEPIIPWEILPAPEHWYKFYCYGDDGKMYYCTEDGKILGRL